MKRTNIVTFVLILLTLIVFSFYYFSIERKNRLINEGNKLIEKIENYKTKYGELPNSLTDIGIEEKEGTDVLYYAKKGSTKYIVWFGMDLSESITYYSDSKKWEDKDRALK